MTTEDIKQIGEVIDSRLDAKLEPIKKDMKGMATKSDVAEIKTTLKALEAGQDDLRDHMKAGFMDLGAKIDRTTRDNKRLIEELEEQVNITNPHKN
jgi:hypothetical protein